MGVDWEQWVGHKFGKLTILEIMPRERYTEGGCKGHIKPVRAKVQCECGRITYPQLAGVLRGTVKTCGSCTKGGQLRKMWAAKARAVEAETTPSIAKRLKAKYTCPYPQADCIRSDVARICCCECDKRKTCGWACKNTPEKCGAKRRK